MSSLTETFLQIASAAELDAALNSHETSAINSADNDVKVAIKRKLDDVIADADIVNNAKTRRRLKRYIDAIEVETPITVASTDRSFDEEPRAKMARRGPPSSSFSSSASSSYAEAPPPRAPVVPVDLSTSLKMLKSCNSVGDVQRAMDAVKLPEPLDLNSIESLRQQLKKQLERIAAEKNMTNVTLRRRMTRLAFVLSTPEEQVEITRQKKEAAEAAAALAASLPPSASSGHAANNNGSGAAAVGSSSSSAPAVYVVPEDACSLADCLQTLKSTDAIEEIDAVISKVSTDVNVNIDVTMSTKEELKAYLVELIVREGVGAKLRRRIKRISEYLETACEQKKEEKEVQVKQEQENKREKGIVSSVKESSSQQQPQQQQQQQQQRPERTRLFIPAEQAAIVEAPAAATQEQAPAAKPLLVALPLEGTIKLVQEAKNAVELENALADVKPESGTMKTRRTLKRAIERLMSNDEFSAGVNAKVRRRLTRVLGMLSPDPNRKSIEEQNAAILAQEKEDKKAAAKAAASSSSGYGGENGGDGKRIPYVVFVGQLSFSATADDLEKYLRSKGIEGDISVRLLTNKETGESKGSAFVELEGARELHKCVALHQMSFQGRQLNIEKSCGGKNKDTRISKIEQKRMEQRAKMREPIDNLLMEHGINVDNLGVDIKVSLYNTAPAMVGEAFKRYAALPPQDQKLSTLDQILCRLTGKTRVAANTSTSGPAGARSGSKDDNDYDNMNAAAGVFDDESHADF